MRIFVATQYTRKLGPRYISQSKKHDTGEEFRERHLLPALQDCIRRKEMLFVVFDGCSGAGVSFLEESFGGLIRAGVAYQDIKDYLRIVWDTNPRKRAQAEGYIEKAHHDQQEKGI